MDFAFSPQQQELYDWIVRQTRDRFGVLKKTAAHWWTRSDWQNCGDIGVLGLCVPEAYGGGGHDAVTTARAIEAFGYSCEDMGLVFSVAANLFACTMPIVEHGEEKLKAKLLPGLCSGAFIGANGITEKNAGSDAFALATRAEREGEGYILNGSKSYVSNGPVADYYVIYATQNPAYGYLGISAFVVPRATPGLTVSEPIEKMGLTSTPACELSLESCSLPAYYRLGSEGQGAAIFKRSMLWERACLFAAYLGMMQRQLEACITYAGERMQFGRSIGKKQAVAHQIVDMKLRLEAARLLLYQACWMLDRGKDAVLHISMAKLAVSEAAVQNSLEAIHIHGNVGFDANGPFEGMLRDAIPSTIFSGTSEIQRDIIASMLGL